jgi:hypothetical protein
MVADTLTLTHWRSDGLTICSGRFGDRTFLTRHRRDNAICSNNTIFCSNSVTPLFVVTAICIKGYTAFLSRVHTCLNVTSTSRLIPMPAQDPIRTFAACTRPTSAAPPSTMRTCIIVYCSCDTKT